MPLKSFSVQSSERGWKPALADVAFRRDWCCAPRLSCSPPRAYRTWKLLAGCRSCSTTAVTFSRREVSNSRSTCTYSRRPPLFSRGSSNRRSPAKHGGNFQPTSGAAWSSAGVFCSSSARKGSGSKTSPSRLRNFLRVAQGPHSRKRSLLPAPSLSPIHRGVRRQPAPSSRARELDEIRSKAAGISVREQESSCSSNGSLRQIWKSRGID